MIRKLDILNPSFEKGKAARRPPVLKTGRRAPAHNGTAACRWFCRDDRRPTDLEPEEPVPEAVGEGRKAEAQLAPASVSQDPAGSKGPLPEVESGPFDTLPAVLAMRLRPARPKASSRPLAFCRHTKRRPGDHSIQRPAGWCADSPSLKTGTGQRAAQDIL